MKFSLRPYQQEGINFLREKGRAMLLDEPGLGKTIQASEAARPPVLVACPTYLVEQWKQHIIDNYPKQTVSAATGTPVQRVAALTRKADWTIINIEMFRSYKMNMFNYWTLIVDESHHLKGRASSQSQGAMDVAKQCMRVYLLTATPIKREPDDLFMQLRLLDPTRFTSYYAFVNRYCKVLKTPWGDKVVGVNDADSFRSLLAQYAIKRGYADVGLQIPELVEQTVPVQPSAAFANEYRKIKKEYRFQEMTLTDASKLFIVLRRMCAGCPQKIDAIKGLLDDAHSSDGVVVFCWYKETAEMLSKTLGLAKIDGDMPPTVRAATAKGNQRVVATIASMSEGVDLSDKKLVIYYEQDYVPGTMYQSRSRAHRWSKDNNNAPVRVHYLNIKGTIDETIHNKEDKRERTVLDVMQEHLGEVDY